MKAQASTRPKYRVVVASLPGAIGPDEESRERGKCVKVCTGSYVTITPHTAITTYRQTSDNTSTPEDIASSSQYYCHSDFSRF